MTPEAYDAARASLVAQIEGLTAAHQANVGPLLKALADLDALITPRTIEPPQGPPGNRIYLVCADHLEVIDAILLGSRLKGTYHAGASVAQLSKWFEQHKDCGDGPDHYSLAHNHPMNWDQPVQGVPSPVAAGIKLALVKGNGS